MSHRIILLAALAVASGFVVAGQPADDDDPDPQVLERLAADLGSDDFHSRERAMVEIRKVGESMVPYLLRNAKSSDLEMRRRSLDLLKDIEKDAQRYCFTGHERSIIALAIVPGDRQVLSGGEDTVIRLWDLTDGKLIRRYEGHAKQVWAIAVAPGGKTFASSGQDAAIRVWNLDGEPRGRVLANLPDSVRCLAFSADGKRLFAGAFDRNIHVIDVATGKTEAVWPGHKDSVLCIAVSPDGKTVLSGGGFTDASVCVRDAASGKIVHRLVGHGAHVYAVAFIDNERGVSTGRDNVVRLWNLKTGKLDREFKAHDDPTRMPTFLEGDSGTYGLAVSRDGKRMLTGGYDRIIRLWDLPSGDEIRRYKAHEDGINALAFTANNRNAVSASNDRTLRVWYLPRARKKK